MAPLASRPIHPAHADGGTFRRPRLGLQLFILAVPMLLDVFWSHSTIGIGTDWGMSSEYAIEVLDLVIAAWAVWYMVLQYTTRIAFNDSHVTISTLANLQSVTAAASEFEGFTRRLMTTGDKGRLKFISLGLGLAVGVDAAYVFVLGIGMILSVIIAPYSRHSFEELDRDFLAGLFILLRSSFIAVAGTCLILTASRVWRSDGILWLRRRKYLGCLAWLLGPAHLRIFGRAADLEAVEAWLVEHGVQHWNEPV